MRLFPLAILMGVAGVAMQLYRRSNRGPGMSSGWSGMSTSGSASGLAGASDLPGAADEWSNPAERMQRDNAVGLHSGAGTAVGTGGPDDLFGSSSQRGEDPVTAGLPDLTRGA